MLLELRRREVRRLYVEGATRHDEIGLLIKILGVWTTSIQFTTKSGRPRTLESFTEFCDLVATVSSDIPPRTVLAECLRLNLVKETGFGYKLIRSGLVTSTPSDLAYKLMADDVNDLIVTIEQNLDSSAGASPNPHAKTYFDNIERDSASKIKSWILRENKKIHKRLRDYLSQFDLDLSRKKHKKGGVRVAFGTFGRVEDLEG